MSDKLRILWLKTGPLHPLDTGGKIRTYNMLRELMREHEVTYHSLWPEGTPEEARGAASEYSTKQIWIPWKETAKRSPKFFLDLAKNFGLTQLPYAIDKYGSRTWADSIQQAEDSGGYDLIICDFLTPAINLYARGRRPSLPVLLFQHNVESLIWKRTYENAKGISRPYFRNQWQRMLRFEKEACAKADQVCAVSEEDAKLLREELGMSNVCGAVPTGVDLDFFQPQQVERKPLNLVFLGSMDWMPNIDGINWFADEVWPAVKAKHPDAKLTIVGRRPVPAVRALADRDDAITVTGTVDDVRPYLHEAAAMIVPLRVGGGTRIKIFEGMATGIPCLSTRIGAEGLPVTHGENVLLADEPDDIAKEIGFIFEAPEKAQAIGDSGRRLVAENYGWSKVNDVFLKHCRSTVEKFSKSQRA